MIELSDGVESLQDQRSGLGQLVGDNSFFDEVLFHVIRNNYHTFFFCCISVFC